MSTYIDGYILTCPQCGYRGRGGEFEPTLCDECFCPVCEEMFIFEPDDDQDDDE